MGKLMGATGEPNYTYTKGVLRYNGRIVVGHDGNLRTQLVKSIHDSYVGGHAGILNTYKRLKTSFYWFGIMTMVKKAVEECNVCRQAKA
jgi:hypothetical protein